MNHSSRILFASGASAALAIALASGAQAQQTAAVEDGGAALNPVTDIVVTAQKRSQRLQDVPISIEVVSGQKLDDFHSNDFRSIMNFVPNVYVESTAGNNVIYIRGFGSPPANFAFDQSVSLYIDGIYAGRSRQSQAPFFDLQRVEVLRGPQGALFGKNTPAGAVSIVSAGPTKELAGSLTGLYNFDQPGYDISGFISGPITDTLGIRVAAKLLNQEGYIKNDYNGNNDPTVEQQLFRMTLKWAPSADFDSTAKVEWGNNDINGGMNVSSSLTGPQNPHLHRYVKDGPLGREGTTAKSLLLSNTANLRLGEYTLTSVTGYSRFHSNIINDFDQSIPGGGVTLNTTYNSYPERFNQWSQEVRLLSPVGKKFEYVIGAYYDNSNYKLTQLGGFNIPALNYFGLLQTNFKQSANSTSVFGQATYHVIDRLRVIGSLRYTHTNKDGNFGGVLVYGPFPLRPLTTATGSISENNTDPSVTLQYDITPRIMAYATYGRGSKSGGFVSNTYGTTNATFTFRPEKSRNYEAGIKSTLANGRLVLNASVYDTKFTNLQVSVYNPTTSSYLTGNAASASSRGIEGAIIWAPIDNLDFNLSGAYQKVKYDDYPGAACLASQPLTECNPAIPASIAANNIAGSPLAYASKYSGNIQGHFRLDVPHDLKLDTTAIVAGRSKYFDSDNQSPTFGVQKAYAKVDVRVQLAPANEAWHIAFVGKNLTNQLTTGSAFNLPAPITPAPRAILYLEPARNLAIEAGIRF